ncbi:MAG: hydroxymethylbilane synthase, partial [Eggerthella sp.]|nr:hydroxymethylbilane synthase [Eggerthella sp.]
MRIGTRGSKLALWQAHHVADLLRAASPGMDVSVEVVKTKGDRILGVALSKIGDKGLFTKELEQALFDGRVDVCVHSMKDVPTALPEGLALAGCLIRA